MKLLVVLEQRAREIVSRHSCRRFPDRRCRQLRIQSRDCRAQISQPHDLARVGAAQRAFRPECLVVKRIHALPAKDIMQMIGERLLDEPVASLLMSVKAMWSAYTSGTVIGTGIGTPTCTETGV